MTEFVDDSTNCAINNKTYNWNRESTRKYIKSFDLSYDSKRIRWSNSFESLVNFVENAINEQGKCPRKFQAPEDSQVLYRIFILHGITINRKPYFSKEAQVRI